MSSGVSTWPYIIVEVVGMPSACAVSMTSSHSSVESRPAASRLRTSSSKISAEVPGRESTPAARSARSISDTVRFDVRAP